ncbi:MAG: transposase [Candidatus Saccharibacteria bacterium]|nr:transposase [Candidatus Saccharibacteria bacterium]
MASRNSRKIYIENTHYHVYNRGVDKRKIFLDDEDYSVFLNLLKRYLSREPAKDTKGRQYPWLYNDIELLAFCLMPNHFHLLVYQLEENALKNLIKNVCGSYTSYFNKKHKRVGPLFQDRFKASMITSDEYLHHISRYIHLNPVAYKEWPYSSLPHYLGYKSVEWIQPTRILELFTDAHDYLKFVEDYKEHKDMLTEIEHSLAS